MAPIIPPGCFILATKWLNLFPIRAGQRLVIDHPKYGIIVKTVACVDKNGLIWSKGENMESLPVEQLGPVSKQQVLGRVIRIFKPV
ncbi:MAG: S24/S26 family peptidase [Thalassotalea sp.]|nr:S24/S26 family peptidase [Thalassotalea sp.]